MAGYFPNKNELAKTGVFGHSDGHGGNTPGKHSPDVQLPGEWNNSNRIREMRPSSSGHTVIFERYPSLKQAPPLHDGQDTFTLAHSGADIRRGTLTVLRNGGEALIHGRDFHFDADRSQIRLFKPIKDTDDDIEIRYQYFRGDIVKDVLLLARGEFTDEQLESFLPEDSDIFNISRLIPNNPILFPYVAEKGVVISSRITEHGIIGDIQLYDINEEI